MLNLKTNYHESFRIFIITIINLLTNKVMRKEDERREKLVGAFLDEHFYSQFENFERCEDKERQIKGIDTQFVIGEKTIKCDEKAAVNYTNLKTFCQEIDRMNRGNRWQIGWFVDPSLETNAYLYVFIDDVDWSKDEIRKAEALLVGKKQFKRYLASQGYSDAKIIEFAEYIKQYGVYRLPAPEGCRWCYSERLPEKPINLLVSRDLLRKLAFKKFEYDITKQ